MNNLNQKSKKELIEIIENLTKNNKDESAVNEINIKDILASMNDFVFIFDKEQRFTFVNIPESNRLYTKPDAFLGKKHHEVMPVEMHKKFEQAFEKNMQGKFAIFKYKLLINNELHYYSARMSPIFKNNTFQGSVAVVSDISTETKAINKLKEEKNFNKKILDTSNAVIVGLDINHKIKLFNKGAEEATGYIAKDLIGKDWFKIFFPDRMLDEMNSVWKKSWGVKFHSYTNEILTKTGEEIIVSWQTTGFYEDIDKNKHLLISIGEDVTSKIEAQNKLLESEEQFRLMFRNHNAIMLLINPKSGFIIDANLSAEKFYGYSSDILCKMNIGEINSLPPKELKQKLKSAENRENSLFIFQHKLKNKEIKTVEVHTEPITFNKQTVLFSIIHDITERIKTEKELNTQYNKIQSIFRAALIGIGVVHNRKIIQVNQRFCEICGYSSDELINQSAEMVYPTIEEYEFVGQEKYKQIQKHGRGTVETQFKRKDGKIIDVLLSSTPFDPNDLNAGVTFTALDITEHKTAEENLRLSEQKFRLLADHTFDWEYWINPNGNYIYISPSCKRITGYLPEEFEANPQLLFDIVHPDDKKFVHNHYHDENLTETTVYKTEFRIIRKGGETRRIEHNCGPVFDENKNYLGRRGNNRDITEAKMAENKLKESEKKFRNTLENIDLVGLTIDRDANIIFANDYLLERTGWKSEEVIGKNWFDYFIPDELTSEIKKIFKRTINKGEFPLHHVNSIKTKSGDSLTINWSNTVHYDSGHNPIAVTSIGEDITENLKNEEELEKYRNNLEQLVKERTEELETMNEELSEANKKLEEFNELFIGREFRIKELRNKIKKYEENK